MNTNSVGEQVSRTSAPEIAYLLAKALYPHFEKPYSGEDFGIKHYAEIIEYQLHIIMNQEGIPNLICANCGKTEQDHCHINYYCPDGHNTKFKLRSMT